MAIKDFLDKLGMGKNPKDDIDDNVTTDRVLRGLRRQRRIQLEEQEKIRLRKSIEDHNRQRTGKYLFGKMEQPDHFTKKARKKVKNVSFTDNSMLRKGGKVL